MTKYMYDFDEGNKGLASESSPGFLGPSVPLVQSSGIRLLADLPG